MGRICSTRVAYERQAGWRARPGGPCTAVPVLKSVRTKEQGSGVHRARRGGTDRWPDGKNASAAQQPHDKEMSSATPYSVAIRSSTAPPVDDEATRSCGSIHCGRKSNHAGDDGKFNTHGSDASHRASNDVIESGSPRHEAKCKDAPHSSAVGQASQRTPTDVSDSQKPWWGSSPELEAKIPMLLQSGTASKARKLLLQLARVDAPITQFYLGVIAGQLEGEAASCDHYERALQQLPLLHVARNNLIRGLMRRGAPRDREKALEHARLSARLQPDVAEMQYQLGVVLMQHDLFSDAGSAYEAALQLEPGHKGALVNGIHCLQQLPPEDRAARKRLDRMAHMGVSSGLWKHAMQRPPHFVPKLTSKPWHDKNDFPWCALLEYNFGLIRKEVDALRSAHQQPFTPVGGRAAHDHTLVVAGEWKEFALYGNGRKYEDNCIRCPATAAVMEQIAPAMELAFAGGGETLFSTLKVSLLMGHGATAHACRYACVLACLCTATPASSR